MNFRRSLALLFAIILACSLLTACQTAPIEPLDTTVSPATGQPETTPADEITADGTEAPLPSDTSAPETEPVTIPDTEPATAPAYADTTPVTTGDEVPPPVTEPEHGTEQVTEAEPPQTDPTPETEPDPVPETDPETAAATEPAASAEPETDAETAPETKPETEPETLSEPETEPETSPLTEASLDGIPLQDFRIVYKDDPFDFAKMAAGELHDAIFALTGVDLPIVTAREKASGHEILIGDTNRDQSKPLWRKNLQPLEYVYAASSGNIVINSEIYLLPKAVSAFVAALEAAEGRMTLPTEPVSAVFEFLPAKSAILIIGDGCGENHSAYALENGLSVYLPRLLPHQGHATTRSADSPITDSAAAGTALATGYKTDNYFIGVRSDGTEVKSLTELAIELGKDALVLTNDPVTGATPSTFTAHTASRYDEIDVLADQAALGVLMLEGLGREPSLAESDAFFLGALAAIDASANQNGFFMMYEESYNDQGSHSNDFSMVSAAVQRLNSVTYHAVKYVLEHPDTLLIITADHETGGIVSGDNGWEFTSNAHTAADVPVHALGYGTEVFSGAICDNTDISKFIAYTLGATEWGDPAIPYAFGN